MVFCGTDEKKNFKGGVSAAILFIYYPRPLSKLLICYGVRLLLYSVLRSQPAHPFHEDFSRMDGRKETDKRTWQVCEMGFKPMWLFPHGAAGEWAEGTTTECLCVWARQLYAGQIQFDCFRVLHAGCNIFPLGFSFLFNPRSLCPRAEPGSVPWPRACVTRKHVRIWISVM